MKRAGGGEWPIGGVRLTAEGALGEADGIQWPEPTTARLCPDQEKNKRLSPPAIQSDNKLSTSRM